jgi:hypothetical protein
MVPNQVRSRPITTDVKAIFDGPSQSGILDDIAVNGSRGFAGPLSYHDPRRTSEYWQSPKAIGSEIISAPPAEYHSKRGSDPLIHDKLRQATLGPGVPLGNTAPSHGHGHGHGHPRSASARTQSLDITSLNFSRTLSSTGGGLGPMPASPAGKGNSPNTASGQYFPPGFNGSNGGGSKGTSGQAGLDGITTGQFPCCAPRSPQLISQVSETCTFDLDGSQCVPALIIP